MPWSFLFSTMHRTVIGFRMLHVSKFDWRNKYATKPLIAVGINNYNWPHLMNEYPKEIVWPNFFFSSCSFQISSIIRQKFDRRFSMSQLSKEVKQALVVISSNLASGNINELKNFVEDAALKEIDMNLKVYYSDQRRRCSLQVDSVKDICFSFPYQIGIVTMNNNVTGVQERFVEISYVFHVMRSPTPELNPISGFHHPSSLSMAEYQDRAMICNYRFIRQFTPGFQGRWLANRVHHFQLKEHLVRSTREVVHHRK